MRILDRRLQILLDDARYRRVATAARERKTSVAAIIREAIDQALPVELDRKRRAAAELLAAEHPLREPSRRLLKALGEGMVTASTTVDVIQEFAHGYARRRPRADAAAQARRYATLLAPLLSPTEADLAAGLQLFEKQERLDAFDAVLAATAIAHESNALV